MWIVCALARNKFALFRWQYLSKSGFLLARWKQVIRGSLFLRFEFRIVGLQKWHAGISIHSFPLWTIVSHMLHEPRNDALGLAIGMHRMSKAVRSATCHASAQIGRGEFLSSRFLHACNICQPQVAHVFVSFRLARCVQVLSFNGVFPEFMAKQPTSHGK